MKLNNSRVSNVRFKLTDEATGKNYGGNQKFLGACLLTSGDTLHFENIQELEDTIGVLDSMRRLAYIDRKELESKVKNHEEDIDMMKGQSLEFNIGYAFNGIERQYIRQIVNSGLENYIGTVSIPKSWFGLSPSKDSSVDISAATKWEIRRRLEETFKELAPQFNIKIEKIHPVRQYIDIDYKIVKKVPIKRMTVEEIEKELGYKVEIVAEKEN